MPEEEQNLPVRKHRAPKGALRRGFRGRRRRGCGVRKHRAPKGALRPVTDDLPDLVHVLCQKAPIAKRCIKTGPPRSTPGRQQPLVRKHRAPKGALRHTRAGNDVLHQPIVRKHRAPKGALRPVHRILLHGGNHGVRKHRAPKGASRPVHRVLLHGGNHGVRKHRAPKGASRPVHRVLLHGGNHGVRKHRASKGALRPRHPSELLLTVSWSESTERQKVHQDPFPATMRDTPVPCQKAPSAKRCIKTRHSRRVRDRG